MLVTRLPIVRHNGISEQTGEVMPTGGIDVACGDDGAVIIAEFEPRANSGRTICIGSGCYDWYGKGVDTSADYYHYNVEQMTLNAINYLCK